MRVLVVSEARFKQAPDGSVWTQGAATAEFWERYLSVFDEVAVLARVERLNHHPKGHHLASGPGINFAKLPYYVGPAQYLRRRRELGDCVKRALRNDFAVILRAPSRAATLAVAALGRGRPFAVEVVGDPYDSTSKGALQHPLRPYFQWKFTKDLARIVSAASCVAYVTQSALQARYPAHKAAFVTSYSSIHLLPEHFVEGPRISPHGKCFRCIAVGSLAHKYKGIDVLIRAIRLVREEGWDVTLSIVGGGKHQSELVELAEANGVGDRITFLGQLSSGTAVRRQLDQSDLFVLPSRQEGLPRAMIEAMARGLPCIGTSVGGVPELLSDDALVPPNDPRALADRMKSLLSDPARMAAMSAENLEAARQYRSDVLQSRRVDFYEEVRRITEVWLDRG